ncbi:MAG: 3'-5' exonuclease [Bdellovibrio sp.]|nr:3'-5' exonuclease [Bdellovibrio sp.]
MDTQSSRELLSQLKFCVFDLETTGGNQKTDNIIEIGLVRIENLKIVDKRNYLIKPEVKIPEFIQKLTTIREDDVKDAPAIEDVIHEILKFMDDSILVAHNVSFDVPFFNSVLQRLNLPVLSNRSMCTNLMTKYLIPNLLNTNLNFMSRIFEIGHKKAHRAMDDAMACAQLLQTYLNIFIEKGITKINHLYYPRNKYELDRSHFKKEDFSIEEILERISRPRCAYLFTLKGPKGIILSSIPCTPGDPGGKAEIQLGFIKQQLAKGTWEMASVRLFGNFVEALMHFTGIYPRIDTHHRGEIIQFLTELHCKKSGLSKKGKNLSEEELIAWNEQNVGDFLITTHLVPDQMIVVPVLAFAPKNLLIFRYPGHQKKLLQYMNSRSDKLLSMKNKTLLMQGPLREFYFDYLEQCLATNQSGVILFKKNIPQKDPDKFFENLNEFLAKNPNAHHYPKQYI